MAGTKHSNSDLWRITRLPPAVNLRLILFALAVGLGIMVILWLQAGVGRQMVLLEVEFAAVKAEAFYVGVQARVRFRRLNESLLAFHLDRNPEAVEQFKTEAVELKEWLDRKETSLGTDNERRLLDRIKKQFDIYLAQAAALLDAGAPPPDRAAFASTYETVERQSRPLLDLLDQFLPAQEHAFNTFLDSSQQTLLSLRRLLNLSLGLLLAAGAALAILLYRGMITPLRRRLTASENIIARQEKLASLGTLAAGVAHEIRNPLTAIKFRLFSFKKAIPIQVIEHEDLGVISAEINRMDRIVAEFLEFARPGDPDLTRLPAQRLLDEVANLLTPELEKAGILLKIECPQPLWVHADTQQIKQVLINLVQNAADSIERNGSITLRLTSGTETINGRSKPAVILGVVDSGRGMTPEVQKRLFDPFFSTKEKGTGLGLAISARIVEKHGGLLRYRTQLNRGTTFEIVLPAIVDNVTQIVDR